MSQITIHNSGESPKPVGNLMIPAGETRVLDKSIVPSHLWPENQNKGVDIKPQEPANLLLKILDNNVGNVAKALAEVVTPQHLDQLETAEQAGNTRKGVINAIAERRLQLASQDKVEQNDELALHALELDAYKEELAKMQLPELQEELAINDRDEERLALINAAIDTKAR